MNSIRRLKAFASVGVLIAFIGMTGCSRRVPSFTVVLVDPSASVTARARADEFAAVGAMIPKMQRGDSLIVIPITNNAMADIEGRILRLHAPERRETYDADLRRFRKQAANQFAEFSQAILCCPGTHTDILGSLDVARQEFTGASPRSRLNLIVLSDFIEDDGTYHFSTAAELIDTGFAARFGEVLRKERRFALTNVKVHLGALESNEYRRLSPDHEAAIRAFWSAYLSSPEKAVEASLDGSVVPANPNP